MLFIKCSNCCCAHFVYCRMRTEEKVVLPTGRYNTEMNGFIDLTDLYFDADLQT